MPKKRFSPCGKELPENLYPDPRKRPNIWRYKGLNGKFKQFNASAEKAIKIAEEANRLRAESGRQPGSLHWWREKYITWREENDPLLIKKTSWKNRKGLLNGFCDEFKDLKPINARFKHFKAWWESLTYDQQHSRRAEFSRFFQYMISEEAVFLNPFTTADDKPRLMEKGKPKKSRAPMTLDIFWKIHRSAGELGLESVQILMGIALVTGLRESDILKLRFDEHVTKDALKLTIGKSLEQRGHTEASHHSWSFSSHPILHGLINQARELSMKNARCPFVISHRHKANRPNNTKEHKFQLLQRHLLTLFAKARTHSGVNDALKPGQTPTSIHEIKNLTLHIAREAGNDITDIQELAAHSDVRVTKGYIATHDPVYKDMSIEFTEEMIGGRLQ